MCVCVCVRVREKGVSKRLGKEGGEGDGEGLGKEGEIVSQSAQVSW